MDYWFHGQFRNWIKQFIRIFADIKVNFGTEENPELRRVPVRHATLDSKVAIIMKNNSENTISSCPAITCWIRELNTAPDLRLDPGLERNHPINERYYDKSQGRYTEKQGNMITLSRYMPVPYRATFQVDIWHSNENQKHQILEQILILFNPSIDLQTSNNPLDWTALTIVELKTIDWDSRTIPIGTNREIGVTTIEFEVPIYLSAPAKITKQTLIHQIVDNINVVGRQVDLKETPGQQRHYTSSQDFIARVVVTPGMYEVKLEDNKIWLLSKNGTDHEPDGALPSWKNLIDKLGEYRAGISQFRIKTTHDVDNFETDIIGFFEYSEQQPNLAYWSVDISTLFENTLEPIDRMIDPHRQTPGQGLPLPQTGQRYLILEELGSSHMWGNLQATKDSIIEYTNNQWVVAFSPQHNSDIEYLVNNKTKKQYKWDGKEWYTAVDGYYGPGLWRLFL